MVSIAYKNANKWHTVYRYTQCIYAYIRQTKKTKRIIEYGEQQWVSSVQADNFSLESTWSWWLEITATAKYAYTYKHDITHTTQHNTNKHFISQKDTRYYGRIKLSNSTYELRSSKAFAVAYTWEINMVETKRNGTNMGLGTKNTTVCFWKSTEL